MIFQQDLAVKVEESMLKIMRNDGLLVLKPAIDVLNQVLVFKNKNKDVCKSAAQLCLPLFTKRLLQGKGVYSTMFMSTYRNTIILHG